MTFLRSSALALATSFAIASSAHATGPVRTGTQADLLDRAVAAWAKVKTARASFEQTIVNSLTGRTMTASGSYQQERPGKLSVIFADPATDRIIADGKHVWMYLPSTAPGQVIKQLQDANGTGTVDLTAQFLTSPRTRFNIDAAGTQVVSGRATHGYTLTPKSSANAPFKAAAVWIDDDDATIRMFEVTDASGVQRKVRLTSFKTNVPVDASAFKFDVPSGVRVVER
ncbi:MAG: outer membrane lipoprotein carrier protein LolA [Gemmatimonadaceae bacterium]